MSEGAHGDLNTGPGGETMQLLRLALIVLCFASCAAPAQLIRGDPNARSPEASSVGKSSVALVIGKRELSDDAEPLEDQTAFGVEAVFATQSGPSVELGFASSSEDEDLFFPGFGVSNTETSATELYLGIRTPAPDSPVRPYLGGGLTYLDGEISFNGAVNGSVSDSTLAFYIHAGIQTAIAEHLLLGVDLRAVFGADLEFAGIPFDGDYQQAAVTLGFWY